MKILHLTDLHFRKGNAVDQQNYIIDQIVKSVLKGQSPDFVFFTGDLVEKGDDIEDFQAAWSKFIIPLRDRLGVDPANVFFCAGNHDVARGKEPEMIMNGLDSMKTIQEIDKFSTHENDAFGLSLKNLDNYLNFQKEVATPQIEKGDTIDSLYTTHIRSINNTKVGIVSINSAWRCRSSAWDRGNLLFPPSVLNNAIEVIKDCSFKIILAHHPLSDLKFFVQDEMENIVYRGFHLMVSGHTHQKRLGAFITSDEGIAWCVAPASVAHYDTKSRVGFALYEVDTEVYCINSVEKIYDKTSGTFRDGQTQHIQIPFNHEKEKQNQLRLILRKLYQTELNNATEHLLPMAGEEVNQSFLEIYTPPVLSEEPWFAESRKRIKSIPDIDIIRAKTSYLISAKDKSGKTFFLKWALLKYLGHFSEFQVLPIYVDCREFRESGTVPQIEQLIARYYQINRSYARELAEKYHVGVLIDNYSPESSALEKNIRDFCKSNSKAFIIATIGDSISQTYLKHPLDGASLTKIFVHDIGRQQMRQLVDKWPNISAEAKEQLLERIQRMFTQLNIPLNYWTVSLFLWVAEKISDLNFHNHFDLVRLYVEKVLERQRFAIDKQLKIEYDDFKSYLGALAHFLLTKDSLTVSASWGEITAFTETYQRNNLRFVIGVKDVMDLLIYLKILKQKSDEQYTFRLNGIFEFSLAQYMHDDPEFRNKMIKDDHVYLSFINEFEFYAGLAKNDIDFLNMIFTRTKEIFSTTIDRLFKDSSPDSYLQVVPVPVDGFSEVHEQVVSGEIKALSPEEQDEIVDDITTDLQIERPIEAQPKQVFSEIASTSDHLEKALRIMGRVFRNTSYNDPEKVQTILDFLLESSIALGYVLKEEIESDSGEGIAPFNFDEETNKQFNSFMISMMPMVMELALFDIVAQGNMHRIFSNAISHYERDKKNNQYKLFILYHMMLDLDVKTNDDYFDRLVLYINLPVLKHNNYIKFFFYLLMRAYKDKNLELRLRQIIEKQAIKIDPKTDKAGLHKKIEETLKTSNLQGPSLK